MEKARAILGVNQFATAAEIREKWKHRVGVMRHAYENAEAELATLNEAFELLQPGGNVRLTNPTNDCEPIAIQRPKSKPPEEIAHVRPQLLARVTSRQRVDEMETFRTPEEDEQIAKNVRAILNLQ